MLVAIGAYPGVDVSTSLLCTIDDASVAFLCVTDASNGWS
jgi:hypothetical protein